MEINGLPLHPLVVHAAVVLGPLSALGAIGYAFAGRWRDGLRWPVLVAVLLATGAIWASYLTGEDFRDSQSFFQSGPLADKIERHEEFAEVLRMVTSAFALATVVAVWLHERRGALRVVVSAAVVAGAVATLVYTFLTGEAGAQAVWGQG